MGSVSDETLDDLYSNARALLYPVEDEDFGIVPVEAMAHGLPVIAHNSGGPKETIIAGETGILFDDLTQAGLCTAITSFEQQSFSPSVLYKHALQFKKQVFENKIAEFVMRVTS